MASAILNHIDPSTVEKRRMNSSWVVQGRRNPMEGKRSGQILQCKYCGSDFYTEPSGSAILYCERSCYLLGHDWHEDRLKRDFKETALNA